MRNRLEEIHSKGFNIVTGRSDADLNQRTGYNPPPILDFNKIKIGAKNLDDAILKLGDLRDTNPRLADKRTVLNAINSYDLKKMREISNFFFRISGIYSRIIRYMAFMYRYDWYVTPYVNEESGKVNEKSKKILLKGFYGCLKTLDDFAVKKTLGEIAQAILLDGAYYCYKIKTKDGIVLQQLPVNYCRSRFNCGKQPAVEFNMKYFDEQFRDTTQRMKVLKLFPDEFSKGYVLYKQGKLPPEFSGDTSGWYLLDVNSTEKFTVSGYDYPDFISVIPLIIDLDEAQALDRKKTLQRLMKIVVQKMPLDKNGMLIFDVEEAQQIHNNAVQMLSRAIGVDVLTTFADVEVEDMNATNAEAQSDDLARVERQLFNEAGISQMQFNTDGNLALEKSILNDEASMYNMLLQFEQFLNKLLDPFNKNKKKVEYRVQILTTTIYNFKELAKLYKEQVSLGYSKMLPQIALGQSQSSILANAYFENDVLSLSELFIPPMQSSTMNIDALRERNGRKASVGEEKTAGRPEKDDDQKSEKTIQNKESQS